MVYNTQHEQWDGTNWTELAELNTARNVLASVGTTTSVLSFGGENPGGSARLANTEFWNGSSWTEVADLGTAVYFNSGAGTSSLALSFTSDPGSGATTQTEEWTVPSSLSNVTVASS